MVSPGAFYCDDFDKRLMSDRVYAAGLAALILFWAIGAYNRLIRQRSSAAAAFDVVQEQLKRYVNVGRRHFQAGAMGQSRDQKLMADAILGALTQVDAALRAASVKPLDALAAGALQTATDTLSLAWARVLVSSPDVAVAPLPESLVLQWGDIGRQLSMACADFNRLVADYNEAIAQFPAKLLAWLFGFHAAIPYQVPP